MAPNKAMQQAAAALAQVPATEQQLKRGDFTLTNGTANARTKVASFRAESPIAFREDAVRMMFVTVEQFQTNATAGDTETFNLSNDIIPTSNTTDFVLFEGGNRVQPDSVDYAGNSFNYTDNGTGNYLHAYYVFGDPVKVEVVKQAPKSQGRVEETVYDDVTSILHERNQHKEPPRMDFSTRSPLAPVVPRKWTVDIYADGPLPIEWDDANEANPQNTTAVNAVVSLPVNRAQRDVPNLAQAVKQDIIS